MNFHHLGTVMCFSIISRNSDIPFTSCHSIHACFPHFLEVCSLPSDPDNFAGQIFLVWLFISNYYFLQTDTGAFFHGILEPNCTNLSRYLQLHVVFFWWQCISTYFHNISSILGWNHRIYLHPSKWTISLLESMTGIGAFWHYTLKGVSFKWPQSKCAMNTCRIFETDQFDSPKLSLNGNHSMITLNKSKSTSNLHSWLRT